MTDKPVTLAVIIGAHGVAGEVRLKLFGEGAETLKSYDGFDAAGARLTLKSVRPGPNGAVARFAEIGDRTAAEALRGTELTVPRAALPPLGEGEYYHADLIDLPCFSSDGEGLGMSSRSRISVRATSSRWSGPTASASWRRCTP